MDNPLIKWTSVNESYVVESTKEMLYTLLWKITDMFTIELM